jgi:hypothetical protein
MYDRPSSACGWDGVCASSAWLKIVLCVNSLLTLHCKCSRLSFVANQSNLPAKSLA